MGLLQHLWDDTLAGPAPENRLRKYLSLGSRTPSSVKAETENGSLRSYDGEDASAVNWGSTTRVTRQIMLVIPPGYQSGSPPISPSESSSPGSPFSGRMEAFQFRRRAYQKANGIGDRSSPSPSYDI